MTRLAAALVMLLLPVLAAAAPKAESDWPCQQLLVPELTAGMVWDGPSLEGLGDWHKEPSVAALVQRAAPEDVSAADGEAVIAQFLHDLSGDRTRLVSLAFAGLLDETNRTRTEVIQRIKDLAERQRNLARLISRLTAELDATPATAQGDAAQAHAELEQRWTFTTRSYDEVQRTMRYACEVPVTLDARLGDYARALEAALH